MNSLALPFVYLSLTQRCNWNCWYCDFPNMSERKDVDINYLKEIVPRLESIFNQFELRIGLEGGEIGLVSEEILDVIFNSNLSNNYVITTNGTFVERGYAKKYQNKIRRVLLHTKPEIQDGDYSFPRYRDLDNVRVWYVIVVHKGNLTILPEFFKQNSDLYWMYPNTLQPRVDGLQMMEYEDYKTLYTLIKDMDNMLPYCKKRFKNIIDLFDKGESALKIQRSICCNDYIKTMINLVTKRIHRCCISMNTQSIELTPDNILSLIKNDKLILPAGDPVCDTCIPGWFDHTPYENKNQIREILKKANK